MCEVWEDFKLHQCQPTTSTMTEQLLQSYSNTIERTLSAQHIQQLDY